MPGLRKLETEGLATMAREDQDSSPSRKTYTITAQGQHVLEDCLTRSSDISPFRDELLLQVFMDKANGMPL